MYIIYLLLSENCQNTYVGFSDNLERRLHEHRNRKVRTTIKFRNFRHFILDKADNIIEARKKEKYRKSASGRRKIKKLLN